MKNQLVRVCSIVLLISIIGSVSSSISAVSIVNDESSKRNVARRDEKGLIVYGHVLSAFNRALCEQNANSKTILFHIILLHGRLGYPKP